MSKTLDKALKELTDAIARGVAYQRGTDVLALDLDRDYGAVERLVEQEEWPFLRSDFELSHAQPGGCSRVAYRDGKLAGFFTTHAFGKIGYLDMMIIAPEFRRKGIARPLYVSTMHGLAVNGMTSYVVHTTNDSARIIGLIGFVKTNTSFTLLARAPASASCGSASPESGDGGSERCQVNFGQLDLSDEQQLIELDASIFGMQRQPWIHTLLGQSQTKFEGAKDAEGKLSAALWLRARRDGAYCIDGCIYRSLDDLSALVRHVVSKFSTTRLECFACTDSFLHRELESRGFAQPEFFRAIGPLAEWHKGNVHGAGPGDKVQCLMWL